MKLVGRALKSKWYKIGQQLGIDVTTLGEISASTEPWNTHSRLEKVFREWEANPSDGKPYKWETVINILKNDAIHADDVATKVEEYYSKKESVGKISTCKIM